MRDERSQGSLQQNQQLPLVVDDRSSGLRLAINLDDATTSGLLLLALITEPNERMEGSLRRLLHRERLHRTQ